MDDEDVICKNNKLLSSQSKKFIRQEETRLEDGLKESLKQALVYLLDLKPAEPYAFLSDYLYHCASTKTHQGDLFISYYLLTQCSWRTLLGNDTLGKKLGQSFELLVHPSSNETTCPAGIKLKDFFTLTTFFFGSTTTTTTLSHALVKLDAIQLALGKVCSAVIQSDERISYLKFQDLLLIHLIIHGMFLNV
jgi:hypothetical protein